MSIPENLKRLRAVSGLSQDTLAKKAGVAQQLISQIERGENLTTKFLPDIARALGVAITDLDPSLADAINAETAGAEIAEIYHRLRKFPEWQAYLLDQARQLEERVLPKEAPPDSKAATSK